METSRKGFVFSDCVEKRFERAVPFFQSVVQGFFSKCLDVVVTLQGPYRWKSPKRLFWRSEKQIPKNPLLPRPGGVGRKCPSKFLPRFLGPSGPRARWF